MARWSQNFVSCNCAGFRNYEFDLDASGFVQHPYFSFEKEDFCSRIVLFVSRSFFLNPNLCPGMVLVPINIFQVTAPWTTRFLSCFSNCQFLDGSLYICWYWTRIKKIQACNQEYFKTSLEKLHMYISCLLITYTVLLSTICIHCSFIHNLHCSLILSQWLES